MTQLNSEYTATDLDVTEDLVRRGVGTEGSKALVGDVLEPERIVRACRALREGSGTGRAEGGDRGSKQPNKGANAQESATEHGESPVGSITG